MLDRAENEIMKAVYSLCDGTDGCFVSPAEILAVLPTRRKYSYDKLERILISLQYDGYFDLITSKRKGEKTYVIHLKANGFAFQRNQHQRQRELLFKIFLAMIGATTTFIFGILLKTVFH